MTTHFSDEPAILDSARSAIRDMTSVRGGSIAVSSASRSSHGILVANKAVELRDGELFTKATYHTFILTLSGRSQLTGCKSSDGHRYEGADHPGALSFFPQGVERHSWQKSSRLRVATLHIGASNQIAGETGFRADDHASLTNGHDPLIEVVMRELSTELVHGAPPAMLLEHAAALVLCRMNARIRPSPGSAAHKLSRRQIERVNALIQARLGESIGLGELAAEAGMSLTAFSRAFKAAVGVSPYRHLTLTRIERAKSLMIGSGLSLAHIAFETGFSCQSQLTRHFHTIVGLTPARFRVEHGRRNRQEID